MIPAELARTALSLSEAERLELARLLVESIATEEDTTASVQAGVQRIEEVATGRVEPLSEEEYRAAIR